MDPTAPKVKAFIPKNEGYVRWITLYNNSYHKGYCICPHLGTVPVRGIEPSYMGWAILLGTLQVQVGRCVVPHRALSQGNYGCITADLESMFLVMPKGHGSHIRTLVGAPI